MTALAETPAEIAARFDGRAAHYDESAMHRGLAASVADFAMRGYAVAAGESVTVRSIGNVLDVATGTGLVLRAMLAAGNTSPTSNASPTGARLTGIDISDGMLAVARAALPSARFLNADANRLPFEDATFDLITCVTALHLLPDASAAILEWRRVLLADGRIVIATFAVETKQSADGHEHHVGHGTTAIERHAPFGSREALERFAATADLQLTRLQRWTSPPDAETRDVCLIAELSA